MLTDSDRPSRPRVTGESVIRWLPFLVLMGSIIASFAALKAEAGETQRRVDRLEAIQVQVSDLRADVRTLTATVNAWREGDSRQAGDRERRIQQLEESERDRRARDRR